VDGVTGGHVSLGAYLAATVPLAEVVHARTVFKVKGGGQIIALLEAQPSIWFRVGQVRASLRLQGVIVSAPTARSGLNQLVEMGYLEKHVDPDSIITVAHLYRRKLSEARRAQLNESVRVSAPLSAAIKARRARANERKKINRESMVAQADRAPPR
jgi:hypothetical protein